MARFIHGFDIVFFPERSRIVRKVLHLGREGFKRVFVLFVVQVDTSTEVYFAPKYCALACTILQLWIPDSMCL